jgi:hypothetical protein
VSPLDGVNGVRRNLFARTGCRWVAACPAREDATVALHSPFQPITCLWQFERLSVKRSPLFEPWPPEGKGHTLESCRVRHKINYLVKCP